MTCGVHRCRPRPTACPESLLPGRAHVTSVRTYTIQFSRTEPRPRDQKVCSVLVSRFRSGTFRRPASSAGGGSYASVFVSSTSFFELVVGAYCLPKRRVGASAFCAFPGFATSETVFEDGRLSTSPPPELQLNYFFFPGFSSANRAWTGPLDSALPGGGVSSERRAFYAPNSGLSTLIFARPGQT